MKPKVFVTRMFPGEGLNILQAAENVETVVWPEYRRISREELLNAVDGVQGIISMAVDVIDEAVMDRAGHLKAVSNYAVGYDNIDLEAATRRGIMVTNTPGVLTDAVADLTLMLILGVARRVTEAERYLREGRWTEWHPDALLGREITGATLGLVGFGRIGRAVARRVMGFDMKLLYYGVNRDLQAEAEFGVEYAGLDDLLARSDFVSLHVPLHPKTRGLIGERELSLMKPSAFLINTARGGIVQEQALSRALKAGTIAGAGLDVFAEEPLRMDNALLEMDNVVLLPHLGSATDKARGLMGVTAARNMVAALDGRRPPNLVNPETWSAEHR